MAQQPTNADTAGWEMSDPLLLVGVGLALAGAGSIVFDATHAGADKRFIGYLVGLLLSLAGIGILLARTL